jgi:hypothetical protein
MPRHRERAQSRPKIKEVAISRTIRRTVQKIRLAANTMRAQNKEAEKRVSTVESRRAMLRTPEDRSGLVNTLANHDEVVLGILLDSPDQVLDARVVESL